jgi:hypothetical protein
MKAVLAVLSLALIGLPGLPASAEEHIHCNLRALSKAERARDNELVLGLRDALRERNELADGYAYRFEPTALKDIGEWLQIVAKCCQPLSYEVALAPQPGGALWVRISGHAGAKEFIDLEFAHLTEKLRAQPENAPVR